MSENDDSGLKTRATTDAQTEENATADSTSQCSLKTGPRGRANPQTGGCSGHTPRPGDADEPAAHNTGDCLIADGGTPGAVKGATSSEPEPPTPSRDDLTRFQWDILAVLAEGPDYGLGIKRALEDEYDEDRVRHGRLYPNLDELVEEGLVEKSKRDERTNEYALTDAGEAAVGEQARRWARAASALDDEPDIVWTDEGGDA